MPPRPHDLLRLSGVHLPGDAPTWVREALGAVPWVVVRRAETPAGWIAVGVRGTQRSQRYATVVRAGDVCEVVTPEELADVDPGRDLAAMRALKDVRAALKDVGWGPTGSVGFELATGAPTATETSDLDLVLRAQELGLLTEIHQMFGGLATRVDCQVETRSGAVALAELVGDVPDVMVRTASGPRLVARQLVLS